jgi:RNA polymerase sigma-70 factor (ECF subfamily)
MRPLRGVASDITLTTRPGEIEHLYREQGDRMWRALLAYAGNPDVASDALAEAFVQAIARGEGLRDPAPWIWTASFRIAAGELKRRGHVVALTDLDIPYEIADPVPHLIEALAAISPHQRLAIVMHDYADRPTDEIARVLGVTRPTVHVHLSQGRKRLRDLLEPTDE